MNTTGQLQSQWVEITYAKIEVQTRLSGPDNMMEKKNKLLGGRLEICAINIETNSRKS
jgi:hypothetical protein